MAIVALLDLIQPAGKSGNPDVCVARSSSVILCPLYVGILTVAGRYFPIGSSRLTKPCFTISAKSVVVNVFVIEAISKIVFPFTFVLFALDKFP